jgi:hypothetical protein
MKNRWSDAARVAALAVRKARAMMANPRNKGDATPKRGGLARKAYPMAYAGASATFDESTGTRNNPGLHIWIPPPDAKEWDDPKFVESFKRGVAERKKASLAAGTLAAKPNIFYSSTGPKGPLDRQTNQGIRYDPKNPDHPQSPMPPKPPPGGGIGKTEITDGMRYIIGGKRYTRVGNKLVPDEKSAPGQKTKVFYQK